LFNIIKLDDANTILVVITFLRFLRRVTQSSVCQFHAITLFLIVITFRRILRRNQWNYSW